MHRIVISNRWQEYRETPSAHTSCVTHCLVTETAWDFTTVINFLHWYNHLSPEHPNRFTLAWHSKSCLPSPLHMLICQIRALDIMQWHIRCLQYAACSTRIHISQYGLYTVLQLQSYHRSFRGHPHLTSTPWTVRYPNVSCYNTLTSGYLPGQWVCVFLQWRLLREQTPLVSASCSLKCGHFSSFDDKWIWVY